jgi:hypothetical protein
VFSVPSYPPELEAVIADLERKGEAAKRPDWKLGALLFVALGSVLQTSLLILPHGAVLALLTSLLGSLAVIALGMLLYREIAIGKVSYAAMEALEKGMKKAAALQVPPTAQGRTTSTAPPRTETRPAFPTVRSRF